MIVFNIPIPEKTIFVLRQSPVYQLGHSKTKLCAHYMGYNLYCSISCILLVKLCLIDADHSDLSWYVMLWFG